MLTRRCVIVGAGGHGKVAIDALLSNQDISYEIVVVDDDEALVGRNLLGYPIIGTTKAIVANDQFHIAIGDNSSRESVFERLIGIGAQPRTIVHRAAVVASSTTIAAGVLVAAGAIIGPEAHVGSGSIINHGAIVDHDCRIGGFVHVAPNATIGGAVEVGARVLIGSGASILPGLRVGDDAIVGSGAVVTADVPDAKVVAGVPARSLRAIRS
jgi:sugar O-acyltransferase (sialic acid O-acetyltransferase NeuD family)